MSNKDFVEAMYKAVEDIRNSTPPDRWYFFTGGTGFPDEVCVEFFKKSNIIVVTRDGRQYCKGELVKDERS